MFGISFSELLLVGLVALLVLGPERLPGAARTAGLWIGRLKRSFNAIKQEVEREIGADEIRRQLHNEHILSLEEEARKIMQPQQPAAAPAAAVAPVAAAEPSTVEPAGGPDRDHSPVIGAVPSPSTSADIGPAAPAGPTSTALTATAAEPAPSASPVITATPPAAVPGAPSANDPSLPPRAP